MKAGTLETYTVGILSFFFVTYLQKMFPSEMEKVIDFAQ